MSFSFFKTKPSLSFIFDIRDAHISVGVARFEKDKKPELILCQRFELDYKNSNNYENYKLSLIKALDRANISTRKRLIRMGRKENIAKSYFFVGSPWSASQAKEIKFIKDKPFEITNALLNKIILGEETLAENHLKNKTHRQEWRVLEEKIIQSKLNGKKVDNFFGQKASEVAVELFVSYIPRALKDKLLSSVNANFHQNSKGQNHSCIMSSYSFFRDLYSDKNDFIYVDMGKLVTDIYVVKDDVIFGIASMPFGEEEIIKSSLKKTTLPKEVFLSHINIGYDKNFDLVSHNRGEDLLKTGFSLWENKFDETISQLCTKENMPGNLFIYANSTISKMLMNKLSNEMKNIDISVIGENVVNGFISNGGSFFNEPYVKMDLVFLNKMMNK